jgi:general secretion pathway protein C
MPERKQERTWPFLASVAVLATLTASILLVLDGLRALRRQAAPVLADAADLDRARPDARPPDARELAAQVLARNMFDSRTGPLAWKKPTEQDAVNLGVGADAPVASEPPQPCAGAQPRLIASVVNSVRPEHSFAALRMEGKTHMLGIGGQLGEVTLLALRPAYAYVRHGATPVCVLPVFLPASQRPKSQPAAVAHAPAAAKPKRKAAFSGQELDAGVRALGGGRFAVSKSLLMRALRSPTGAALGARLRPVERYGRTVGWELARLRKDSALARMGLQKGDLLRSVNGHELSDAGALLVALRMLQQTDSVTLAISRGNVVQHLQYTLD